MCESSASFSGVSGKSKNSLIIKKEGKLMSAISRPVTKVDFAQLDGYGVPADGLGNLGFLLVIFALNRNCNKKWTNTYLKNLNMSDLIVKINHFFNLSQLPLKHHLQYGFQMVLIGFKLDK